MSIYQVRLKEKKYVLIRLVKFWLNLYKGTFKSPTEYFPPIMLVLKLVEQENKYLKCYIYIYIKKSNPLSFMNFDYS